MGPLEPITHQFLREQSAAIVEDWEQAVVACPGQEGSLVHPGAGFVLRRALPALLAELADWMERPDPDGLSRVRSAAIQEVSRSLRDAKELNRLVWEIGSLRAVLMRQLLSAREAVGGSNERDSEAWCAADLLRLSSGIDQLIAAAVEEFAGGRDRELARSRLKYEKLVELSPDAIVVSQADRIVFVNAAAAEMGCAGSAEEIIGTSLFDFIQPAYLDEAREQLERMSQGEGGVLRLEQQVGVLDGSVRDVEVMAARFDDGDPTAIQAILRDITERKQIERELRETDRRKSEFIAMLSHELRNPLDPIKNGIYLLERAAPGSSLALRALRILKRQADHLTRLVDDLLDTTRMSMGKISLKPEVVDLRQILRNVCDDYRATFENQEVMLYLEDGRDPVWVNCDADRITQALGNLFHNASKFTPAGGETAVSVAKEGGWVEVRIRDTGIGIEEDRLDQMFEPFVQADDGLARTRGGLGLGLSLVKGLVELHGGRVSARSGGAGEGTEVLVTLPLAGVEAHSVAEAQTEG